MRIGNNNINGLQNLGVENSPAEELVKTILNETPQGPTTAGAPTLGPGESVTLPNDDSMPDFNQGQTNGCGTTSLAMILSYLGVPTTQGDVDGAIRRTNIFTNPTDILDYARSKGMNAEGYNHGSLDEIKSYIDKGIPVQTLITADGSGDISKMHYVAVVGYGKNADGSDYIKIHDPATGTTKEIPQAEFEQKWGSTPLGFDHYFNAIAKPPTELPPSRMDGIEGTLAAADGVANVTNGADRLVHPKCVGDFVHGMFQLPGGVVETIGGGIGAGLELGADWLKDKTKNIPVLNVLAGVLCNMVGGLGAGIGDLSKGFGSACDDIGSAFGNLFDGNVGDFFSGLGSAVGDVASGIGNAAVDVAKGVGNAVSDVGSAIGDAASSVVDTIGSWF